MNINAALLAQARLVDLASVWVRSLTYPLSAHSVPSEVRRHSFCTTQLLQLTVTVDLIREPQMSSFKAGMRNAVMQKATERDPEDVDRATNEDQVRAEQNVLMVKSPQVGFACTDLCDPCVRTRNPTIAEEHLGDYQETGLEPLPELIGNALGLPEDRDSNNNPGLRRSKGNTTYDEVDGNIIPNTCASRTYKSP